MDETSEPHDTAGVKRPPRAAPLQPDKPGSGTAEETATPSRGDPDGAQQKEQSDNALDNVREGYD